MSYRIRFSLMVTVVLLVASHAAAQSVAAGLGVNVPLLGRLTGGGNTLFVSTIDVTNHGAARRVDFYVDGVDLATRRSIAINGSVSGDGQLVAQGIGAAMRGEHTARYDDFIESLIAAGMLGPELRANGFLGSVLFVFDGVRRSGLAGVTARFFSALGDGTVGVAMRGQEMSTREPQRLIAPIIDTRGTTGTAPKLYSNLFINNTGISVGGSVPATAVTVVVSARTNGGNQSLGTPLTLEIQPGHTVAISPVFESLQIPSGSGTTIQLQVDVISGNASIAGVVSQVDAVTRDASVFAMNRAD